MLGRWGRRGDDAPPRTVLRRRNLALLIVVALAVAVAIGGLVASTFVKSPAQVAAETAAPKPTLLTAQVTREVVSNTLVMRATVTDRKEYHATPTSEQGAQILVVTAIDRPAGSAVRSGDVIAEVSGRPLFVLQGDTPAYRDIEPGDQGKDVAELQASLRALGFSTGMDANGTFGAGTKAAVTAFYHHIGYTTPTTGSAAALQPARQTVTQDERDLASLEAQQSTATRSSAAATTRSTATTTPKARTTDATGSVATESTTKAGAASSGGGVSLATQITWARQDLAGAQRSLASLQASSGPMVPLAEVLFLPAFPAHVVAISGGVGDPPGSPFVTLASGAPVLVGQLDPSDGPLVHVGSSVQISDQVTGYDGRGTVTAVSRATSTAGSDSGAPYLPVTIVPHPAVPASLVGQDVQVTIDAAHTSGAVLAVPVAAIFAAANGATYVSKAEPGGSETRVAVRTGITGANVVAITPLHPGALSAGDRVITGLNNAPTASQAPNSLPAGQG